MVDVGECTKDNTTVKRLTFDIASLEKSHGIITTHFFYLKKNLGKSPLLFRLLRTSQVRSPFIDKACLVAYYFKDTVSCLRGLATRTQLFEKKIIWKIQLVLDILKFIY